MNKIGGLPGPTNPGKDLTQDISELAALAKTTYTYANLLNTADADYATGQIVSTTTGALSANASYNTSGFIPVNAGDKIVAEILNTGGRIPTYIRFLCGYNASKVAVSTAGMQSKGFYIVPSGVSYIRVSTDASAAASIMIEKDVGYGVSGDYLAYGTMVTKSYSPVYDIDIFLPDYIYIAIGQVVELYYKAMMPIGYERFAIRTTLGASTSSTTVASTDKITITGVSAGNKYVRIDILDSAGNIVASRLLTITTVAVSTVTKTICPIGDSLTNGKPWIPELIKYNTNLTFVGSKSSTVNDSGGTPRAHSHEGRSGWSAKTYCTVASSTASGSSEVNPFWDATLNAGAGGFSWSYYVTNTLSGVAPNIVMIFLGQNNLIDDEVYIKQMVDNILTVSSTMPIMLLTPQYRDFVKSFNTAEQTLKFCLREQALLESYANLYIVPVALMFDGDNNYISGTEVVNPRSAITQPARPDPIHATILTSYFQISDAAYGVFSAKFTS